MHHPYTPLIGLQLQQRKLSITNIEGILLKGEDNSDLTITWLDKCRAGQEAKESEAYEKQRSALHTGLTELRGTVQDMISRNDTLPLIEQLERHEFVLDVEGIRELKQAHDDEIARKEEEIHLQNLSRLYLKDKIEEQCWSTMQVSLDPRLLHLL